jgi:Ring finger domain
MLALIVIGYIPMLKCCSVATLLLCFGPSLYRAFRRARRPDADWVPTHNQILSNLMKNKFKPKDLSEGTECVICMMEYTSNDDLICLPCDSRHFFHAECITDWLKHNNSCPMCKKPITLDDLKNQKK